MEDPSPPEVEESDKPRNDSESELREKTEWFKAGVPLLPSRDAEKKDKAEFSSQLQYILAVIGLSVGLGNIWRFPAVAFDNGGGAFLIPYLCMGMLFGLPMLYLDSSIGQFMQSSPTIVFRQFFPFAQGLGWTMASVVILIALCYNVPCCWALMYILQLIRGRVGAMSSCENEWNTEYCMSTTSAACEGLNGTIFFNKTCVDPNAEGLPSFQRSAPQEFFELFIIQKHASFEFGSFNWMFALCLFACWSIVAAGLLKGVQSMGKVSLVTTLLPYVIITILFFRGITLDGAGEGIDFFLTNPNWSMLLERKTWVAALSQCTFSLSIGVGSMIMMASYNKRTHPNLRDCVIILCADTFMSVIGGTTVFCILGSMAKRTGKNIKELIDSPLTLTFIAYPDAISQMPVPTLWALLFFLMMFLIGISTMLALVEGFATCIIDENPRLAKWHWLVVTITCAVCFILSVFCFTFQNGYHIFSIVNELLGTVSLSGSLFFEIIIVMACYCAPRLFRDIQCMHGLPTSLFARFYGNLGVFIKIGVSVTAPLLAITMCVVICIGLFNLDLKDKIDNEEYKYPLPTVIIGIVFASIPLMLVPFGAFLNLWKFKQAGKPIADIFRITDEHPSIRYNLPEPVSWKDFFWPQLRTKIAPLPEPTKQEAFNEPEPIFTIPDHAETPNGEDSVSNTSTVEMDD